MAKIIVWIEFIDLKEVEDYFVDELMADAPQGDRCTRFADYLVDNYISLKSRYPPVLWAKIPLTCQAYKQGWGIFPCSF